MTNGKRWRRLGPSEYYRRIDTLERGDPAFRRIADADTGTG